METSRRRTPQRNGGENPRRTKFATPATVVFLGGRYYRLTYKQNTPDNFWNGGDMIGVEASDGADAADYDLIARDLAGEIRGDHRVLTFQPGRYRVHTRLWSSGERNIHAWAICLRSKGWSR